MEERKENEGLASFGDASDKTQEFNYTVDDPASIFETTNSVPTQTTTTQSAEVSVAPVNNATVATPVEPQPVQTIESNNLEKSIPTEVNNSNNNSVNNSFPNNLYQADANYDSSDNNASSSKKRITVFSVLFAALFILGFFLIFESIYIDNAEYVNYIETSNIDYRVYLKENTFYDEEYLNKDMVYVASLIDHIDIDFLYNINISEKLDLDFDYNMVGVLNITDSEGKKTFLKKSYDLTPKNRFSMDGSQDHTITENIVINYDEYNQIANAFKATYGVDSSSKLLVYFNVDKVSSDTSIEDVATEDNLLMEIPLSERSVSISMDYKNINNNSSLIKKKSISVGNIILLIIAFGVLLASVYVLFKLFKLIGIINLNRTPHDKFVNKIMKQYDRLIVEHYTFPKFDEYNIVNIKEFDELLDMRDNLKAPILYFNAKAHEESYFYIQNNKDLYLFIVKNDGLEKEK